MFAKFALVTDLFALVHAAGALLDAAGPLVTEAEAVALEAVALVRHLDLAAAQKFVADTKSLFDDAMKTYNGSSTAIEGFVTAWRQLIADARG